jgi:pimeloyl-ACP methyl ester carboxylesterase
MPATQPVTFPSSTGAALAGRLELPDGTPSGFALFAHCFTCSKESAAASRISRELAESGLGVLRFDFTGLGESAGDFADTTFSANVDDLGAAAGYLRANHEAPTLLVGHSLGGAAVLSAASHLPEVRAVVTIGAPYDPIHVLRLLDDALTDIAADGAADVLIGGRTIRVGAALIEDLRQQRPALENMARPLLVLHSPHDTVVGVENARRIFEAARHPKSFVALDRADHLLTSRTDAAYAARLIATWAQAYLDRRPDTTPSSSGGSP